MRSFESRGSVVFRNPPHRPPSGFSLPEVLVAVTLLGIMVGVSVPLVVQAVARERLRTAGLEMATTLRALRQKAVTRRESVGLKFVRGEEGWTYSLYQDGNSNGIRSADIRSGRDPFLYGPRHPGQGREGIRFGLPTAPIPRIPPSRGVISDPGDPIKLGRSDILSFSPGGSTSSGTLYLTDGREALGIVVYGPTGRVRVFRYDSREKIWRRP